MKRLFAVGLGLLAVVWVAAALLRPRGPTLPEWGTVPNFRLTSQEGKPFGTEELAGRVWVADFIFTTCPAVCPRMTGTMASLQSWLTSHGLGGRVHLVSVSVDPARDTPDKLLAYANKFHAQPDTWTFLTGPQKVVEDAIVHGFKIAIDREKDDSQDGFALVHGTKFVLIDAKQTIRGYYDSNDHQAMEKLRQDLSALVERGGR